MSESAVTITIDLAAGQYSDVDLSPPQGVTVDIDGTYGNVYPGGPFTTIVGNSPAVTVSSGNVILTNVTLTTATDSPTLLVSGGHVTLTGDDVQSTESTDTTQTVIAETGGSVSLQGGDTVQSAGVAQTAINLSGGTMALSGDNNTLSVTAGAIIQNTTGSPVSVSGQPTYEVDGSTLPAASLSFTSLATSASSAEVGQSLTLTATVIANGNSGSATPTGSVDFYDTTTGTDLSPGGVTLDNGVATLATLPASSLAAGPNVIVATYSGDGNFAPSLDSLTQTVTVPLTITVNNASKTYGAADPTFTVCYSGFVNGDTPASLGGTLVFTTNEPAGNAPVGSYSIMVSGLTSTDYAITFVPGTLTVNKYAFSYTIGNVSQTYGSPANLAADLGTTIKTGVNGQNLDIAYASSGDTATAAVGAYPITGTVSNGSGLLSNYSVTLNPGTLTVTTLAGSIYVLDPTAGGALSLSGNAEIDTSGNVVVDSSSTSAILASSNATVTAASVQVVGGVSKSGNAKVTKTGTPRATGNPLSGLAAPTVPTLHGHARLGEPQRQLHRDDQSGPLQPDQRLGQRQTDPESRCLRHRHGRSHGERQRQL